MARHLAGGTDEVHWVNAVAQPSIGCVSFWIKTTSTPNSPAAVVLSHWNSNSRLGFGMLQTGGASGKIQVAAYNSSTNQFGSTLMSTTNVNDGNPHHIAFNLNRGAGNSNQFYVDGVQEATVTPAGGWGSGATTDYYVQSGDNVDTFWTSWIGDIWELGFWNGAQLSAEEIASLAKGYSPKIIRPNILMIHAPLVRDIYDRQRGYAATATGGSVSDHGRVIGGAV